MATFADRLKALRQERGLTQSELADKLNIGRSALAMYESGKRIPKYKTIDIFADFFDVSADYLRGKISSKHGYVLSQKEQEEWFEQIKTESAKAGHPIPDYIHTLPEFSAFMEEMRLEGVIESQNKTINQLVEQLRTAQISLNAPFPRKGVKIPVLGKVVAGIPLEAVEEILDYEEITPELAATGEFFALQIRGRSMEPRMLEGDVVIVKRQDDVESGDVAIVLVNGDEATVKKIKKMDTGITLIATNTSVYEPHFYSNEEIKTLPVQILGKVVELRGKF